MQFHQPDTLTDVRLGAQGIETGTRGTLYFDDFESRRFSYIGTLPDPGVYDPQATNAAGWFARTYTYSATIPHAVTSVSPETGSPDTYSYDANGNPSIGSAILREDLLVSRDGEPSEGVETHTAL